MEPSATAETEELSAAPETSVDTSADDLIADELLVEEISIDGMCGVY